ncbi:hypothetical protein Bhyg_08993 [Pseudolycoriella hygida]|uniref:Uncharacterized protein n=1 Tax=Pseudolycoriella hygida TaxID=35572 RepID=A0A9Q0N6D6_9DIPT|nr:hypothetical protein Bhyg_08993 [Pseudolycoriella hygida]
MVFFDFFKKLASRVQIAMNCNRNSKEKDRGVQYVSKLKVNRSFKMEKANLSPDELWNTVKDP